MVDISDAIARMAGVRYPSIDETRARAQELLGRGTHHLIAGALVRGEGRKTITVVDPSTEDELGELSVASAADVDRAVTAAAAAQPGWYAIGPYARWQALQRVADALEGEIAPLAMMEAMDSGNPLIAMRNDIIMGIDELRYLAACGLDIRGSTMMTKPHRLHYTQNRPYGVVGRIIPFNHPARFFISKAVAPLIAGNGIVIKPPEQAPLTALMLAEVFNEHLPKGLVNVVSGDPTTGDALVRHPRVKRIAFTGSVRTGMRIQSSAAEVTVKAISLELGGKNPMIVLPDADLAAATDAAVVGMNLLTCAGQSCGSNSRVLVHDTVFEELSEQIVARYAAVRVGAAYLPDTEMGPLISATQFQRVTGFLDRAQRDGVTFATGGGRPEGMDRGYFVAPTVIVGPETGLEVASEEIFGPVLSIMPFGTEAEAVALANRVEYGLTASVWTHDVNVAHRMAAALEAGYVWVNDHGPHYLGTPFGGLKTSGTAREESTEEILSYTECQTIHLDFKAE